MTGVEVVAEGLKVLEAICEIEGLACETTDYDFGGDYYLRTGEVLPDQAVHDLREFDAIYLGAVGHPDVAPGILEKGILLKARFELDQYINLRPVKLYPGVETPLKDKGPDDIDFVVVRENTEGLYSGIEFDLENSAVSVRVITKGATERIAKFAFDLAMKRRKRVTIITKVNIMRKTCGLFREISHLIAKDFPSVKVDEMLVDAAAMNLILKPTFFDVILTANMFGDILSDEAAGLVGGLGMAPSANIGDDYALFEPVHGSAPDISGKGIANPIGAILSAKMMLEYLGEKGAAKKIENAVENVLREGKKLTPDLGGDSTTNETTEAIIDAM